MNQSARSGAVPGVARAFVRSVEYPVLYLLAPNVVFWIAGWSLAIVRPWVILDYLVIGLASRWLPRLIVGTMVAVTFLLDVTFAALPMFHFTEVIVLRRSLDAAALDPAHLWAAAGIVLAAAGVGGLLLRPLLGGQSRMTRPQVGVLGLLMLLTIAADIANGTSDAFGPTAARIDANIAGALWNRVFRVVASGPQGQGGMGGPPLRVTSATELLLRDLSEQNGTVRTRSTLLVLVESGGLPSEPALAKSLRAPFDDPAVRSRYTVRHGAVEFRGATVPAELRELCGVEIPDFDYRVPPLSGCLPQLFRAAGVDSVAYHGFTRHMLDFDRVDWYPRIGFGEMWFAEDLAERFPNLGRCGTLFRGLCDRDIVSLIRDRLRSAGRPEFLYFLTLNSHLPVSQSLAEGSHFDCATSPAARNDRGVCALARVVADLHERLAILAADPSIEPLRMVVVGDHSPPFSAKVARAAFSATQVPFVELVPRPDLGRPAAVETRHGRREAGTGG